MNTRVMSRPLPICFPRPLFALITVASLLTALLGCGKPQTTPTSGAAEVYHLPVIPVTTTKTPGAPLWIDNPTLMAQKLGGGITAVGSSPKSVLGDPYFQRSEAHARGSNLMAIEIRQRIKSAYTGNVQANTSGSDAGTYNTANAQREDLLNRLVDMQMSGVRTLYHWTDPQTGVLYVLLHLSPQDFRSICNQFTAQHGNQGMDETLKRLNALQP